MKKLIIILIVVILGVAIYYGRFLFKKDVVSEELPEEMKATVNKTREGSFQEIDFIHKGSGRASLLEAPAGHKVLRLEEDFRVTNGPDLYVYLSKNMTPGKNKESLGDFINLGRLKGNEGSQNYEITQDITDYRSVVIWCQQFGVLFSYAELR